MKAIRPTTSDGKVRLVEWLNENDKDFLEVLKATALVFGPLQEVGYRNNDDDKHKKLNAWMNEQKKVLRQ
ncbi:MAG: hypothetical protein JAY90_20105 [Candidatus Thiodiazotropha lotti]|nr:hypothetical protein [Candidatus Thiodiazotropha lotti]